MEVKKSEKALLKNKRFLFAEIGLVVALVLIWAAFQTNSKQTIESFIVDGSTVVEPDDLVPITLPETPPPPVEIPKIPELSDKIEIVNNEIDVKDIFISLEDEKNLGVEITNYIAEVEEEELVEEVLPVFNVESKPKFNGGDANEFSKWVNKRVRYPEIAKQNGVEGKVILEFVIDAEGNLGNIKVIRSVDTALDEEALRVVSSSPKWEPGRQRDRKVKVKYIFPVIFRLN